MNIKKSRNIFISIALVICVILVYFFSASTKFNKNEKNFYIHTNDSSIDEIINKLQKDSIISSSAGFTILSQLFHYEHSIKPGKYTFQKGSTIFSVFWILFKGKQVPVKLVINKFRTRESLTGMVSDHLECDSLSLVEFMNNVDSVAQFNLDTNNCMTLVIPNTYEFFWDNTATSFWRRMKKENEKFWTKDRLKKANDLKLSKEEIYILASIVEEESNKNDEKSTISSVYINRIKKRMTLAADPTIKFALRDFSIKRITLIHINNCEDSPYNTYRHKGLPPGPICTPSIKTIDAVLNTQKTDFLFFCAKSDFSGYHSFASTAAEHYKNAHAYQKALDKLNIK